VRPRLGVDAAGGRGVEAVGDVARGQVLDEAGLLGVRRADPGVAVGLGLYPDAEAEPAATGICTTLRNPALTRIEVDSVQVFGSTGDEIAPRGCQP
jgi:hypothetical protein